MTARAARAARCLAFALPALVAAGCRETQSVLAPRGPEAERIETLTWVLFWGGGAIFAFVMAVTLLAWLGSPAVKARLAGVPAVFAGGVAFPAVTITALLVYGLTLMEPQANDGRSPVEIAVKGEQWWWRVSYAGPGGRQIESANEIRVPAGRPVKMTLTTADVIHSFWVPNLAGKVDMIPGRTNVLRFTAARPGVFRGQCAEYCGGAHAKMAFRVVAMPEAEFGAWLASERDAAAAPVASEQGKELFLRRGCPACHAVTGLPAVGVTGPNLTRVGGRAAIAGETLPMSQENLALWIARNEELKPGNGMPSYASLPKAEVDAMAAYLASLR